MKHGIYISNLASKGKNEAILEILDSLEIEEKKDAYEALLKREELSSTLVKPLVAIPHAKSRAVEVLTWVVAISRDGVLWDDGRMAKIIVLTLSPLNASGEHVVFLSHVAKILDDDKKIEEILSCKSESELEEVLLSYAT